MRPLHLTLQAFGSYAGTLEIDFARMGRHGVFAITGPTGSGKSTIFDALVYALYGDLPGFREDGNVRSQYAEPATSTRVAFQFEAGGGRWSIERSPRQFLPRKRGSGPPVDQPARVVLQKAGEDSGGFTRQGEVDARVLELVGLTKDQFEQVVLIPQGRFEEVLKADTRQRSALLTRLFPVDVYARVTDALKAIAAARQADFERAELAQRSVMAGLVREAQGLDARLPEGIDPGRLSDWSGADPDAPVDGRAIDLDALLSDVARVKEELDGLVAAALDERERARTARDDAISAAEAWDQWRADLAAATSFDDDERADAAEEGELDRARSVAALAGAIEGWRQAVHTAADAGERRDALLARIDASEEDASGDALLRSARATDLAARIAAEADRLDAAERQFASLSADAAEIEKARVELARRHQAHAAAQRDLDDRAAAIEEDSRRLADLALRAADRDAADGVRAACEEDVVRARRRDEAVADLDRSRVADEAASDAAEVAKRQADEVRAAWRQGLAGRLAAHLVDGEPCPTCGSTDHPAPAVTVGGAPDDDAVARADDALDVARRAHDATRSALAAATATLAALGGGPDLASAEAALQAATARSEAAQAAEAERAGLAGDLERRRGALSADREALAQESSWLTAEAARLDVREEALDRGRDAFVAEHGSFRSLADEAATRRTLAGQVRELVGVLTRLEEAEAARDQYRAALAPTMAELAVDDPAALAERMVPPAELDRRRQALTERRDGRNQVRIRIAAFERAGVPEVRPDPAPAAAVLTAAEGRSNDLVGRQAVVAQAAANLLVAPEQVAASLDTVERARRAYEEARTVSLLCAGQGGAGVEDRLSLQNWVLAAYLRQVLAHANVRLSTMTGGRFALRLGEGTTDGRRQSGLDLAVFDVNTGQIRPATTLSGGETFMAALSLALGLADVVSGGANRDIGALFVDEGFGSLDGQSLDGVVEVLRSLEDGGRVVGVISHVAELNRSLPNGITVSTSNTGSHAVLHYPPD
ncbi:MAG: SMC family ATPase [Actinomycetota bacterium]|nr:SMC family ATPase [Actinomycetota bacterium]